MKSERLDKPPFMVRIPLYVIGTLMVTFLVWAGFAEVDELTRGEGRVITLSKTQVIQSSEAGIVQEIAVVLGQAVSKGDLLIQLDDTSTNSSLGEVEARSFAFQAKINRLRVESGEGGVADFKCSPVLLKRTPKICQNEQQLFVARRASLKTRKGVLESRLKQRRDELKEAQLNITRLSELVKVMQRERKKIAPLVRRRLHPEVNLLRLDREITESQGQKAVAEQSTERLTAAVLEAELQTGEVEQQFRQEARRELSDTLAELGVLDATLRGAEDRVRRTDIRSPVDGIVNTLDVNTIGAFVQPGAVVAGVVPTSETLLIEARISPRDVAFVQPGQETLVKVTAYDFSIFGGLKGTVANVSADSIVDQESGETFYNVRVKTTKSAVERGGQVYAIRPGMVASVEILTGRKTVLSYLLKPLTKARDEALTER